ncbi:alpha/beta fold hydrolase [Streptacidiphilus melanogenes]|uniref:alpha/beta fold hydrolase n=1 Tax=Streptacidiphilus melanogenes TaxID=411235 RepID=UPI0005A81FA7|nr:alpha/beta hydrolase [Streptacidiphilus melanogenes]
MPKSRRTPPRTADRYIERPDGARIALYDDGNPDGQVTALLVHGAGSTHTVFDALVTHLTTLDEDLRIVRADQRGHGSSTLGREAVSLRLLGEDLAAVVGLATTGPVVVVAHSLGGLSALALADARPDLIGTHIAALLLAATTGGGPAPSRQRGSDPAPSSAEGFSTRKAAVVAAQCLLRRRPLQTVAAYCAAMLANRPVEDLSALADIPVEVLVGDRDLWTPPSAASHLAGRIPSANLHVLPRAGHFLPTTHPLTLAGHTLTLAEHATHTSPRRIRPPLAAL